MKKLKLTDLSAVCRIRSSCWCRWEMAKRLFPIICRLTAAFEWSIALLAQRSDWFYKRECRFGAVKDGGKWLWCD